MEPLLIFKAIYLATILGSIAITVFISFSNIRERFNLLFVLMNICVVFWAVGRYALLVVDGYDVALFWARILYIGSIFVYIFFLHAILVFLGLEKKRRAVLVLLYINAAIISIFNFFDLLTGSSYFIYNVIPRLYFPFYETPGLIYNLHLLQYLFIPQYAFIEMLVAFPKLKDDVIKRGQLKYIIFASVLGFIGGNSVVFLVYNIYFIPYLVVFVPFYILLMAFAIFQYHLFNLKTILTELLVLAILTIILVQTLFVSSPLLIAGQILFFILVAILGYLLVRSVLKEVKTREQIETLNQQLQASVEELQKLDQLKSDFVNLASHQLRAPLTPIKGFSDMLRKGDIGPLTNEQKDVVDKIFISSERMVELVNDFLNVSRLEKQGGFTYNFVLESPIEIVKKIVDELKEQAREKGLDLSLDMSISPQAQIRCDNLKFSDALQNIIHNAIKYTLRGNIWIKLTEDDRDIVFTVRDTGVGIDKDDIPKIFQKFFRGREVVRLTTEGTGLGLYFTRRVIEDHGGHVWVESEGLEKGTQFTVKIPKVTNATPVSVPVPLYPPPPAPVTPLVSPKN